MTVREDSDSEESGGGGTTALAIALMLGLGLVVGLGAWAVLKNRRTTGMGDPVAAVPNLKPVEKTAPGPEVFVPAPASTVPLVSPGTTPPPDQDVVDLPASKSGEPVARPKRSPKVRVIDDENVSEVPANVGTKITRTIVRTVPGVDRATIDASVKRGVDFLLANPKEWMEPPAHELGYAAFTGLTLLECKVAASHPSVQSILGVVRQRAPTNGGTYDLAAAILFLDRLGNSTDRPLIQLMAARLIAGQKSGGGWDYTCPILQPAEASRLLGLLSRSRPVPALPSVASTLTTEIAYPAKTDSEDGILNPFGKVTPSPSTTGQGPAPSTESMVPTSNSASSAGLTSQPPKIRPKRRPEAPSAPAAAKAAASAAGGPLEGVPALANLGRPKSQMVIGDYKNEMGWTDNSNTQFALLGLWAARRHGVASDHAILLADLRFRKIQNPDGSWGYSVGSNNAPDPGMTCAGLLGLGLGNAIHQPHSSSLRRLLQSDRSIQAALKYLGQHVQAPVPTLDAVSSLPSLYLLWSIERAAVLYDLPYIEEKDWYGWGAQTLIKFQRADGAWESMITYTGSQRGLDTCFAVLFLIRSNLVQEITEQIRVQMPLSDSGR